MAQLQRRFPPRNEVDPSQPGDVKSLSSLGKRTERLLFSGLLLTALCFAEICFSLATVQFESDKSLAAQRQFSKRIEEEKVFLIAFYKLDAARKAIEPLPPKKTVPSSKNNGDLRESLGLSRDSMPMFTDSGSDTKPTQKDPQSYAETIKGMAIDAAKQAGSDADALQAFTDPALSPDQILAKLRTSQDQAERQPIEMFGIRAPHSLAVEYGGSNFQLQYDAISAILLILLGPLICGWMTSLYMTRQREMLEISRAATFTAVFPHVMNFIPVGQFRLLKRTLTDAQKKGQAKFLSFLRVIVAIIVTTPMLAAYVIAVVLLWPYSNAGYLTIPFLIYLLFQTIALLATEGSGLPGIYFSEA